MVWRGSDIRSEIVQRGASSPSLFQRMLRIAVIVQRVNALLPGPRNCVCRGVNFGPFQVRFEVVESRRAGSIGDNRRSVACDS